MSTSCLADDVLLIQNNSDKLGACLENVMPSETVNQTESQVIDCLTGQGISTDCSRCFAGAFIDGATCLVGVCGISPETPTNTTLAQPCVDCLAEFGSNYRVDDTLCGIPLNESTPSDAVYLQWTTGSIKDTPVRSSISIRSFSITAVLVAALLLM